MNTFQIPSHPFTRAEAIAEGITSRQLSNAVATGELRRPFRGVYVGADLEDTADLRASAIALITPPHSVVCDRTAAYIHGVNAFGYGDLDLTMPVELCSLRGHPVTRHKGVDGRTRDLADHDLMQLGGLAVTTPLRTALDLGCGLTRLRALGVMDELSRKHRITRTQLHQEVTRYVRRRGVIQLRRLIPLTDWRAESQPESWTRLRIHDAGLPRPNLQFWIEIDGVPTYRLDLAYPHLRIAIEYDGWEFHRRTPFQKAKTAKRRAWLEAHGWTVIVVDVDNFFDKDGEGWLRELRGALRSRTQRLRWARTA